MEKWQPIEGYEKYLISNTGKVFSEHVNRLLKAHVCGNGYYMVDLIKDSKRKTCYVHRLVAQAFCTHPDGCNVVNHIDSNKLNNDAANLEWVTQNENLHHAMNHGRFDSGRKSQAEKISKPIMGTNLKTGEIKKYKSINETKKDGFKPNNISHCLIGYRKSHHGYTWCYAN